jgi:hypothetical protein
MTGWNKEATMDSAWTAPVCDSCTHRWINIEDSDELEGKPCPSCGTIWDNTFLCPDCEEIKDSGEVHDCGVCHDCVDVEEDEWEEIAAQ